jgi:replicative DNA helicase
MIGWPSACRMKLPGESSQMSEADVILFSYRDAVYNPDSQDKGMAEIIIGKQRNGPNGSVGLAFIGEYTKFENLAHDAYRR